MFVSVCVCVCARVPVCVMWRCERVAVRGSFYGWGISQVQCFLRGSPAESKQCDLTAFPRNAIHRFTVLLLSTPGETTPFSFLPVEVAATLLKKTLLFVSISNHGAFFYTVLHVPCWKVNFACKVITNHKHGLSSFFELLTKLAGFYWYPEGVLCTWTQGTLTHMSLFRYVMIR